MDIDKEFSKIWKKQSDVYRMKHWADTNIFKKWFKHGIDVALSKTNHNEGKNQSAD